MQFNASQNRTKDIPVGTYIFEIVDVQAGVNSQAQTPNLTFTCVILKGEFEGRYHFERFTITDRALSFLGDFVWPICPDAQFDPLDARAVFDVLAGIRFSGTLAEDTPYQGRVRTRIKTTQALDAGTAAGLNRIPRKAPMSWSKREDRKNTSSSGGGGTSRSPQPHAGPTGASRSSGPSAGPSAPKSAGPSASPSAAPSAAPPPPPKKEEKAPSAGPVGATGGIDQIPF